MSHPWGIFLLGQERTPRASGTATRNICVRATPARPGRAAGPRVPGQAPRHLGSTRQGPSRVAPRGYRTTPPHSPSASHAKSFPSPRSGDAETGRPKNPLTPFPPFDAESTENHAEDSRSVPRPKVGKCQARVLSPRKPAPVQRNVRWGTKGTKGTGQPEAKGIHRRSERALAPRKWGTSFEDRAPWKHPQNRAHVRRVLDWPLPRKSHAPAKARGIWGG